MPYSPPVAIKADASKSQLVVIDVQDKLAGAMPAHSMASVQKQIQLLLEAAKGLSVPTVFTEQYPKGLGNTLAGLSAVYPDAPVIEKISFSCCDTPSFIDQLQGSRHQIILVGMEAHICVLQTALDLLALGKQVFVVQDAILSRAEANHANALQRLQSAGAIITNAESVAFEWLRIAQGDVFKHISRLIR